MHLSDWAYAALIICTAGTAWRMGRWFHTSVGPESETKSPGQRMTATFTAVARVIFSRRIATILRAMVTDIVLQRRIVSQNRWRWTMHMGMFCGVVLLVLMHALDDHLVAGWVSDYAATRNPFMWLRHLLGLMVVIGLVIALVRRSRIKQLRRYNTRTDRIALVLLATIVLSGIALEATQIISASLFDEMVVDYWGSEDEAEIAALQTYWADQFEVAFNPPPENDRALWDQGRIVHEDNCAACHTRPQSAFMAFPVAMALKPMAPWLDRIRLDLILWQCHFLVSCLALAYLPFGKLFHLLATPVSLAIDATGPARNNIGETRLVRRAMGMDACTHCGVCSRHCSVAPIQAVVDNPAILPSEKIGEVDQMARQRLSPHRQWQLSQGSHICTACGRCTDLCPSGIDLQDLWQASEEDLDREGYPPPHKWIRTRSAAQWADKAAPEVKHQQPRTLADHSPGLTDRPETFWACVQCTTCTTVCPVVAASHNPQEELDMTPQQVMNLMRLELKEMALGCRMVWDCVTCYKCQEHCPQGVPVADVLYELRNAACRRLSPEGSARKNPNTA